MEPTDFKNVIVENIPPALFKDAEVAEVGRKFYCEKSEKLDDFEILASATSKMTSKPQQPRRLLSGFYLKLHF